MSVQSSKTVLSVRIPSELKEILGEFSSRSGIPVATLVERAIEDQLELWEEEQTILEGIRQARAGKTKPLDWREFGIEP